jgi:hypothetical protein
MIDCSEARFASKSCFSTVTLMPVLALLDLVQQLGGVDQPQPADQITERPIWMLDLADEQLADPVRLSPGSRDE